eukprot:scaffold3151_cov385-Prasinococcus_capsulatus_cf.AAC.5
MGMVLRPLPTMRSPGWRIGIEESRILPSCGICAALSVIMMMMMALRLGSSSSRALRTLMAGAAGHLGCGAS